MKRNINPVPSEDLDIDEKGLKNLAGWLARYVRFGVLDKQEHSPFICEALKSGTLTKFEPELEKCKGVNYYFWGSDEEYEKYEFTLRLELLSGENFRVCLMFTYEDGKATSYLPEAEYNGSSNKQAINETLKKFSEVLGEDISEPKEKTWEEADNMVLKYLKYIHALNTPIPPTSE